MKIQYLGHACFRLISDMGTTLVCDPFNGETVGYCMPRVRADVVTVSHHHDDHDCVDEVCGSPAQIDCEVTCCADDVTVSSLPTFHDEVKGAKRGSNLVFCFEIDGLKVVHMGDVGLFDENIVGRIANCDILMLPVGGTYTVDAQTTKKYVDAANPNIVLPMHYKCDGCTLDIAPVNDFVNLFNPDDVQFDVSDSLVIQDVPENARTKVVVLRRYVD